MASKRGRSGVQFIGAISMAEGGGSENSPVLTYEYKCESCKHVWQELSQQKIGLACSQCGSSKIRAPSKRGTYKYKCDKCDSKWKKKNSTGGVGFCPTCTNGIPIYPYKLKPDVSLYNNYCVPVNYVSVSLTTA